MHAYVYLGQGNAESPEKEQGRPVPEPAPQGEVEKHGHAEMVAGMGGNKTIALRAVTYQHVYPAPVRRFVAGAQPYHILFEDIGADEIAKEDRARRIEQPDPARFPEINEYEQDQEKVKRVPQKGIAQPGHQSIEERIAPFVIDDFE